MIALNPFANVSSLYGPEIIQAYAGRRKGELEPHLYAIAQDAYSAMIRDGRNQTIIVSGESGAGKTVSASQLMRFLASVEDPDRPSAKKKAGMTETEHQILASPFLSCSLSFFLSFFASTLNTSSQSHFGILREQ